MTARLRSDFQVSAIRQAAKAHGAFCTILKHGHDEAGMIHLVWRKGGSVSVWSESSGEGGARGWRLRASDVTEEAADTMLEKEKKFDPDLWVVELDGDVPRDALPGDFFDQ